jgi:hypothetical protein
MITNKKVKHFELGDLKQQINEIACVWDSLNIFPSHLKWVYLRYQINMHHSVC